MGSFTLFHVQIGWFGMVIGPSVRAIADLIGLV